MIKLACMEMNCPASTPIDVADEGKAYKLAVLHTFRDEHRTRLEHTEVIANGSK